MIDGWEVAQDAALDLPAFGPDLDCFGDDEIAVLLHRNVANKTLDALLGKTWCDKTKTWRDKTWSEQRRKGQCCKNETPDHALASNETVGRLTSSVWK